jgi:hypothetical protein
MLDCSIVRMLDCFLLAMSSAPTTAQGVPPRPCPGCGAKMAVGSLVCTRCGYDLRTGRRWDTALGRPPPKQRARAFWEALRFLAQVGAVLLVAVLIGVVLLFAAHLILLTAYPATPHPDAKAAPAGPAGSAGSNPTNTLPSPLLYA